MKQLPLHLCALLGLMLTPAFAGSANEIIVKHDAKKAGELANYLEENPEADDRMEAVDAMIGAYQAMGETEKMVPLVQEKYDDVKGVDLQQQFQMLGFLVNLYQETGQKDKAREVLADAPNHLGAQAGNPQIMGFIQQMQAQLDLPGPGDEMKITFTDINGHKVDTTNMPGKVVLVDFWATWCGPCIAEMPNVIKAYNEWNEKGFEIVGISLDEDKSSLEAFIKENDMPWPQYFDGKGWDNELAAEFGISGIPATFLLKDGKVVASNLRGQELEQALAKHLNEG